MIFLLIFIFIPSAFSISLECKYSNNKCIVQNTFKITSKDDRTITEVKNELKVDPEEITSIVMDSITVKYFPKKLENFFKKLDTIMINNCDLQEVEKADLEPLKSLEYLTISGSKNFKKIPADLFMKNPKIKALLLPRNSIEIVEQKAFDHFDALTALNLDGNVCISNHTDGLLNVQKLIQKVYSVCSEKREIQQKDLENEQISGNKCANELTHVKIRSFDVNTTGTQNIIDQLTFRLSQFVKPIRYELLLHPNLNQKTFTGNVKIEIVVLEEVHFIALHAKLLTVTKTKLTDQLSGEKIKIKSTFEYKEFEYFVIELETLLRIGNYTIEMDFDGPIVEKNYGMYSSSYYDKESNKMRVLATTQFESTYARQSFPCFDEPSMKATFKVSLISPATDGYHALSNMDIESTESYQTIFIKYNFRESVPMSTYILAFIVSDFKKRSGTVNEYSPVGKPFELSIYSSPDMYSKTEYAYKASKDIIEYFVKYFNVEYPLPKMDLAAIPDFANGAMENWGLVTYRDVSILYDPGVSSSSNKHRVCLVIAHEFAHMWFGNLVTMRWWNDLWLNEGFAAYIQYKGMAAAEPTWAIEDQFTVDTMHMVLDLDATLGSHPIVVAVQTPNQIAEIFDTITYKKGASIIRMIEDFVGPENFQKGVTEYLKEMKYKNADSNDLLRNLKKFADDLDINLVVNTWIRQKGYPVVNVKKNGKNFILTQKRFFTNPENEAKETVESSFRYRWSIPITYITSSDQSVKRTWFNYFDEQILITLNEDVDWIKFNMNQKGYYRVNYEPEMWQSISNALKKNPTKFSVLDRAHLLNDVFSLAQAGEVPYETALKMIEYLGQEDLFMPWSAVGSKLNRIKALLYNTEVYKLFMNYVVSLVDEPFKKLKWTVNSDDYLDNLMRSSILDLACSMEHQGCLDKVKEEFLKWINGNPIENRPHPDIRGVIYSYGMSVAGTEEIWNKVFEIFTKENDPNEKAKLMNSLTAVQDFVILKQFLKLASSGEKYVRSQDYFHFLSNLASNRKYGENLVWDHIRTNWQNLIDRFGLSEPYLGKMIPQVTSRFAAEIRLQEMKDFFTKYPDAGAGANARKQALENIQNNIKWLKKNKDSIGAFLTKGSKGKDIFYI